VSNSVLFLLLAFGLSVLGATAVWLHGRPRRHQRNGVDFNDTLRALAATRRGSEPPNGVGAVDPVGPARSPRDPRRSRERSTGS
jgi:hypothetical protein